MASLPPRPLLVPPTLAITSPRFCHRLQKQFSNGWKKIATVEANATDGSTGDTSTFLTLEEAGLIELSNLDMHERFLCRLTVSSLNLLRIISKQEGVPIEELNAGKICDWFQKDKAKREKDVESATLKWPEW